MTRETRYLAIERILESISERCYCASYMSDIEQMIDRWEVTGSRYGQGHVTSTEVAALKELTSEDYDIEDYNQWMADNLWL